MIIGYGMGSQARLGSLKYSHHRAISRAIVEAHQGTIHVTSDELGEGTTFCLDMPIH